MKRRAVSIGIIGYGTVGSGVVRILIQRKRELKRRLGFSLEITRIADIQREKKRDTLLPKGTFTTSAERIINDPGIDIVVELIGGITPARKYIMEAIRRGKHVVTANKLLLATGGMEIFRAAGDKDVEVGFEGAVAGGIPIIKVLRESLIANKINALYGIINGTSNYILTKMKEEGIDFTNALREAQKLGYAEADPTLDVEGGDSAHKLTLLAALAFGIPLSLKEIYTEGITHITPQDIGYASEFGYAIKPLAIAKKRAGGIELRVHPTMLPEGHHISGVNGVFNAVYVEGDAIGPALYYGKGAGDMPTGSAVVSDIAEIARNIWTESLPRMRGLGMPEEPHLGVLNMDEVRSRYYLRLSVREKPGVLSKISGILGSNNISIQSVIQKGREKERNVFVVMMTHEARERDMVRALKEINKLPVVSGKVLYIRVE